jgi:dihydrofolate synthase/folylpolyglutamate synthase
MGRLLAALGEPHKRLPYVLIAGTNGKGSTAALVHSMLVAAGYRSGLYTSPHLESVRERVRIDGRAVAAGEFSRRLEHVVAVAEAQFEVRPTYFEALTAVAFDLFAEETEIAVFEVGLGGRLDATNVGDPLLSLITEIGIDHVEFLGSTEIEIAREKGGIMRPDRPVLSSVTGVVRRELEIQASSVGALWIDVLAECSATGGEGEAITLTTPHASYRLQPPLPGEHQRRNLMLAVRAAEVLAARGWPGLSDSAIVAGVGRCQWPGRLERVELEGGREVLLDGAHNPQGAAVLATYLAARPARDCLLFGALTDKDVRGVLPCLAATSERVVLTSPPTPRALPPESLLGLVGDRPVTVVSDPAAALEVALAGDEERVVVCGSIYLMGEVRRLLRRRFGRPTAAVDLDLTAGTGSS